MAIFLLIYVLFLIMWLVWSGILVYHTIKYRFPQDTESKLFLIAFLAASIIILIVSFIAIGRADWLTLPKVFGGR